MVLVAGDRFDLADHDAQALLRHARGCQQRVFQDGDILAVAGAPGQRHGGRLPDVDARRLGQVANSVVDMAIPPPDVGTG
jgi:hypothetical protein